MSLPAILSRIIGHFRPSPGPPVWGSGPMASSGLILLTCVHLVMDHQYCIWIHTYGMMWRVASCTLVYRKVGLKDKFHLTFVLIPWEGQISYLCKCGGDTSEQSYCHIYEATNCLQQSYCHIYKENIYLQPS